MLAPILDELSGEVDSVDFYNVDVDENPDLAREFRIMNIPAVVALKDGQIVGCLLYTSVGVYSNEYMAQNRVK